MESIESTADIRVQKALERGFIRPDATEIEIRLGLEDMHEASLTSVGPFAVGMEIEIAPAS